MTGQSYLSTIPFFLLFFVAALALLAAFAAIYMLITPHNELRLIRSGNAAAAVSLSGALIGFVIPLASVVENSINLIDMLVWGVVAMVVQVATFIAARLLLPDLIRQIEAGRTGPAGFVATLSVAVGVLNAACVTY